MSDLIERFQAEIDRAMPMLSSPPKRTDAAVVLIDGMAKIEAHQAEIARLREALTTLKGHCNKHIKSINQGEGIHTRGFAQINKILKQCDEAFKALEQKP